MQLTDDNYYSQEANLEYMSVSQYKDFAGTYGRTGCEFCAMEKIKGNWIEQPTNAMMVGSYVDAYFEGSLNKFKMTHPEIFTKTGDLKAEYIKAEQIIGRVNEDQLFMEYMSGQKQVIMTGELFGAKWKVKLDSYAPGIAITDLKVMSSITKLNYVKDIGDLDFVRYWGYDIQGAVYQEIVRQNTGDRLPFYIAAVTKETEPNIEVIQITQNYLDEAMSMVEHNMDRILSVKNGIEPPERCEICECCRHTKVLKKPISIMALTASI